MDILSSGTTSSSSSTNTYSTNSVTGLVDGINVDSIVSNLMLAARAPEDALQQKVQVLQWQQDDYRTINTDLQSLQSTVSSLKYQGAFLTKSVSSSSSAVTATAGTSAMNTSHTVDVTSLATSAVMASQAAITAITSTTSSLGSLLGSNLSTVTGSDGTTQVVNFSINDGTNTQDFTVDPSTQSLNDVINEINNSGLNVQASWDSTLQRFYLTSTASGSSNSITYTDENGTNLMQQLFGSGESTQTVAGTDAQVTVDGTDYSFNSNQFSINGVSYTLQGATVSNTSQGTIDNPAIVTVTNNASSVVSAIQNFVTAYNNTLTDLSNMLTEQNYNQSPLTQDEITAKNLDSTQIDDWNTKAKSGLLNSDPLLQSAVYDMRDAMSTSVSGLTGQVTVTNDDSQQVTVTANQMGTIGLTTSSLYTDYGKLTLNTDTLTEALQSNPQAVMDLFTKTLNPDGSLITDSNQQGLAVRIYNALSNSIGQITDKAGSSSDLVDNSYIGQELSNDNTKISDWDTRLNDMESRYYTEYDAMETTLSQLNTESAWLSQVLSSSSSSG